MKPIKAILAASLLVAIPFFLMNQKAVAWVNNTRGWEIGTGPSVVIVDKGMAITRR